MKANGRSMRAARKFRRALTPPEVKLWSLLPGSPCGIRFRRQYAVGPYVADFCCPKAKLVIEVDGLIHDFKAEADQVREEYLKSLGLRVMRVSAREVMRDTVSVADSIVSLCSGPSTNQLR